MTRPDLEGIRFRDSVRPYFCNKCGYFGATSEHDGCDYYAGRSVSDIPALLDYIGQQASVIEAARTLIDGYNSRQNKSRAGTVANLRARLAEFDSATLSTPETVEG